MGSNVKNLNVRKMSVKCPENVRKIGGNMQEKTYIKGYIEKNQSSDGGYKCPRCSGRIEPFLKGIKCENTLMSDVALSYLKRVKHGEKELNYMQFEKCNHFKFNGQ